MLDIQKLKNIQKISQWKIVNIPRKNLMKRIVEKNINISDTNVEKL